MDDSEMDGPDNNNSIVCQETDVQNRTVELLLEEEEPYCFSNPRRGVAVVIVYSQDQKGETRPGWEIDQNNLIETFFYLGFDVRNFKDLSKGQLLENLTKVSQEDHSDCDCFVLAVSSHGQERRGDGVREDEIVTIDQPVKTSQVVDKFTNEACLTLTGKPRIFFIQACRGKQLDHGHEISAKRKSCNDDMPDASLVHDDRSDVNPMGVMCNPKIMRHQYTQQPAHPNIVIASLRQMNLTRQGRPLIQEGELSEPVVSPAPCHKDFLVMYATPPGYFAFRRPSEGSWFVKSLAEVLCESDGTRHLIKELTRVIRLVAENYASSSKHPELHQKKQTPVMYSMLCKDIYMAPKNTLQVER